MSVAGNENELIEQELEALNEIYGSALLQPAPGIVVLSLPVRLEEGHGVRLILPDGTALPYTLPVLPDIVLTVRLNEGYPQVKPGVHVKCDYASLEALGELVREIDGEFVEGEVVVFEWAVRIGDFVENKVLEREGEEERGGEYVLRLVDDNEDGYGGDKRWGRVGKKGVEVARELQSYARRAERKRVNEGWFLCPCCWEMIAGLKCMGLMACGHVGCRECLKGFWGSRIVEGRVMDEDLVCLKDGCGGVAGAEEVREVVDGEVFEKYERFVLDRILEKNGVVRCGRKGCEEVAWVEGRLARCGGCEFAFCVECGKAWHGEESCVSEEVERLVEMYEEADGKERDKIEEEVKERGGDVLWERVATGHALAEMKMKMCPQCGMGVEKNGGCAHMKCVCGCDFCWHCSKPLVAFMLHYDPQGGCDLYEGEEEQAAHEEIWNWMFHGQ